MTTLARGAALVVSNALQVYIFGTSVVYMFISFLGFRRPGPGPASSAPLKRFAVLVPAYNEQAVIAFCLESLLGLDYPRELFDVYLVADHCTDGTARIAREHGVVVYEHEGTLRGKGHALRWATERVLALGKHDAFCYFDADSLAHPGFLRAMSARLAAGQTAIQGCELGKNADEGMLPAMIAVGHLISNRFWQSARYQAGLSAMLHGKGMCFTGELMRTHHWEGRCLTEDLDMRMQLIRSGVRICWAEEAVVFNEEPTTVTQYIKRTVRWAKGGLQVARAHLLGLLIRAFKHGDLKALDAAIWCCMVYRLTITGWMGLLMYQGRDSFQLLIWLFQLLPPVPLRFKVLVIYPLLQYPILALYWAHAPLRLYVAYLLQPVLGVFRVPIFLWSVFNPPREWYRTEHNSRVGIRDLVRQK